MEFVFADGLAMCRARLARCGMRWAGASRLRRSGREIECSNECERNPERSDPKRVFAKQKSNVRKPQKNEEKNV